MVDKLLDVETSWFLLLEWQEIVDDMLDYIAEQNKEFLDGVRTSDELADKLIRFQPLPPDSGITVEMIRPLVGNWWNMNEAAKQRRKELKDGDEERNRHSSEGKELADGD